MSKECRQFIYIYIYAFIRQIKYQNFDFLAYDFIIGQFCVMYGELDEIPVWRPLSSKYFFLNCSSIAPQPHPPPQSTAHVALPRANSASGSQNMVRITLVHLGSL